MIGRERRIEIFLKRMREGWREKSEEEEEEEGVKKRKKVCGLGLRAEKRKKRKEEGREGKERAGLGPGKEKKEK